MNFGKRVLWIVALATVLALALPLLAMADSAKSDSAARVTNHAPAGMPARHAKKTPTITISGGPFTYDGQPHAATVTVKGAGNANVGGSLVVTYNDSTTAPTAAGTYKVVANFTPSEPSYGNASAVGSITIDKANAAVKANNQTKAYGDDNPPSATVEGAVNGETLNYSLSTPAWKCSDVGAYPIVVVLGSNTNYNVTKSDATLTITKKPATVQANDQTKVYGDDMPSMTATLVGEVTGCDAINWGPTTPAWKYSEVRTYPIEVFIGSNPNYDVTPINGTLTIAKKNASVKANDQTKTYGQDNPPLTATVVGEVTGGDAINWGLTTTADKDSAVGTYPIVVFIGSNPNYNVTATDGTLTIAEAPPQ
jgi:hypothetical protein